MAKPTTTETQTTAPPPETKTETQGNLATQPGGEVALSPEELAMMAGDAGKQKFSLGEIMVPVLKIANQTTEEMKRSSGQYIEGIQEGDFIDTARRVIMRGAIEIVVVRFETTYIESKPEMGPTVRLWGTDPTGYNRAVGGDVGIRVTKDGNEIRAVGTYYVLLLLEGGASLFCMMYLGSTSWKAARSLNYLLGSYQLQGPNGPFIAPPYARVFKCTTVPDHNEKNSWMTWKFEPGSSTFSRGKALYQKAKDFEAIVDARLTRVAPTDIEDDRRTETQGRAAPAQQNGGPPGDEPPPPTGEGDYGGGGGAQQAEVVGKAAKTPF